MNVGANSEGFSPTVSALEKHKESQNGSLEVNWDSLPRAFELEKKEEILSSISVGKE